MLMTQSGFDDKMMMTDLLNAEKQLTGVYNTFLCESATTEVMNCLAGILNDEHAIKNEIFQEMSSKGWYKTEKAEDAKLNQTKQQFAQ
ncbi:MAG: spore coat protein [Clostridia bacterium]|nr:spore coat protein [Clostridia bacterium]